MRFILYYYFYLVFLCLVGASRVCQSIQEIPSGWTEQRNATDTELLLLHIGLKQSRLGDFEQRLLEISSPKHSHYGRHLSKDLVNHLLGASDEAHQIVSSWLQSAGITNFTAQPQWISVRLLVWQAERLLESQFRWYHHSTFGTQLRTRQYCLPKAVAAHVDLIEPTLRFDLQQSNAIPVLSDVSVDPTYCTEGMVTPSCVRNLYNVYTGYLGHESPVAIVSFVEEYARYRDLALFEQRYAPDAIKQSFTVIPIAGGLNEQDSPLEATESNSDVQYMKAISAPAPLIEYSVGYGDHSNPDGFLDFLTYMLAQPDSALPSTIAISYGQDESSVPRNYAVRVCNMFGQLGARGVSVIFAAGDHGVGDRCQSPADSSLPRFGAIFPPSCPWVTTVGALQFDNAAEFSSGGFSEYFNRSEWQSEVVGRFLRGNGDGNAGYFNPTGRAFPDVAAQGVNLVIVNGGKDQLINGTSLSAPIFGGIVARANSARITAGKSPLGFLNPLLYHALQPAFTDVVAGSTIGCVGTRRGNIIPGAQWNSTSGWDPASGLGYPDEEKFVQLSLQLP